MIELFVLDLNLKTPSELLKLTKQSQKGLSKLIAHLNFQRAVSVSTRNFRSPSIPFGGQKTREPIKSIFARPLRTFVIAG